MKNGAMEKSAEPDPRELAEQFGPFAPPEDFALEPEFDAPVPRPIPKYLKSGAYERSQRQMLATLLIVGLFCVVASRLSFVRSLAYYLLFLGYLDWFGIALMVIGAVGAIRHFGFAGRYAYVKKGHAFPARVLEVGHYAAGSKDVPMFGFCARVEYVHPETGETRYSLVRSPKKYDAKQVERFSTPLRPGDYVTAVWMPEKPDSSLQLYGFLDLDPDVSFILKDGAPMRPSASAEKVILALVGFVAVIALVVFGLYSTEFRFPLEYDSWVFAAGVAVGALFFGFLTVFLSSRLKSMRKERRKWGFIGFGLGGILPLFLLPVLNSGLDRSEPQYREVEIVDFWQETTYPVFIRNYRIEYRELGSGRTDKYPAMVSHMQLFSTAMAGAIEVKEGLFGWPWVRQIHPAVLVIGGGDDDPETLSGRRIVIERGKYEGMEMTVAIVRGSGEYLPVSETLAERVRSRLEMGAGD